MQSDWLKTVPQTTLPIVGDNALLGRCGHDVLTWRRCGQRPGGGRVTGSSSSGTAETKKVSQRESVRNKESAVRHLQRE